MTEGITSLYDTFLSLSLASARTLFVKLCLIFT